jgi:hypothetical protein
MLPKLAIDGQQLQQEIEEKEAEKIQFHISYP